MPTPVPKPVKRTAEERRAERRTRPSNPLKPRIGEQDVLVRPDPLDHARFKTDGSSLHSISRKKLAELQGTGNRMSSTFRPKPGTRRLSQVRRVEAHSVRAIRQKPFGAGTPIKVVGRRGVKLEVARKKWRERIYAIHGMRCIMPGCQSSGPFEVAHAYGKGAHPELHTCDWNGFPACVPHHRTAQRNLQFTPELTTALQECADEMRAAMENRRPQPSWDELQSIILRWMRRV